MDTNPCYLLLDPVKLMVSLEIVCNRHQRHQIYIYIYIYIYTFIFIFYYIIIYIWYIYNTYIQLYGKRTLCQHPLHLAAMLSWSAPSHEDLLATSIHCAFAEAEQGWIRDELLGWTGDIDIGSPWWTRMCPFPVCSPEAIHHVSLSAPVQRDMIKHD